MCQGGGSNINTITVHALHQNQVTELFIKQIFIVKNTRCVINPIITEQCFRNEINERRWPSREGRKSAMLGVWGWGFGAEPQPPEAKFF